MFKKQDGWSRYIAYIYTPENQDVTNDKCRHDMIQNMTNPKNIITQK